MRERDNSFSKFLYLKNEKLSFFDDMRGKRSWCYQLLKVIPFLNWYGRKSSRVWSSMLSIAQIRDDTYNTVTSRSITVMAIIIRHKILFY